jgi:hypothetical protein
VVFMVTNFTLSFMSTAPESVLDTALKNQPVQNTKPATAPAAPAADLAPAPAGDAAAPVAAPAGDDKAK